ncbi:MAG: GspMb/PilO family protein [Candidatus Tyrphobacter sp.]
MKAASLRAVWFAAVAGACIAYVAAVLPQRHVLRAIGDREAALYARVNRDDAMLAREPAIEAARERARAAVLRIGRPLAAATLLEALERLRARFGIRVVSVRPATSTLQAGMPPALAADDVRVELVGSFRSILNALASLRAESEVVEVDSADLSVARGTAGAQPLLHAAIGVRLYTLATARERRVERARPVPTR